MICVPFNERNVNQQAEPKRPADCYTFPDAYGVICRYRNKAVVRNDYRKKNKAGSRQKKENLQAQKKSVNLLFFYGHRHVIVMSGSRTRRTERRNPISIRSTKQLKRRIN